jgi:hypothetical protein
MNKCFVLQIMIFAAISVLFSGCGGQPQTIGIDPMGLMNSGDKGPKEEVELGSFEITVAIPGSFEALYVNFNAFGIVPADRKYEIEKLIESHKTRLRDRIHGTVQGISPHQLKDPRFVWLKSELARTINKELKVQDFDEIVFSGFSLERR